MQGLALMTNNTLTRLCGICYSGIMEEMDKAKAIRPENVREFIRNNSQEVVMVVKAKTSVKKQEFDDTMDKIFPRRRDESEGL